MGLFRRKKDAVSSPITPIDPAPFYATELEGQLLGLPEGQVSKASHHKTLTDYIVESMEGVPDNWTITEDYDDYITHKTNGMRLGYSDRYGAKVTCYSDPFLVLTDEEQKRIYAAIKKIEALKARREEEETKARQAEDMKRALARFTG
jgi:predicted aminopeptidase